MKPLPLRITVALCLSISLSVGLIVIIECESAESVRAQSVTTTTNYSHTLTNTLSSPSPQSFTLYLPMISRGCTISSSEATRAGARLAYSFDLILPCLNTPDLVSQFMHNNIVWDDKWDQAAGGNEYVPAWIVYERGSDDCDGHAILQCYLLEKNGWDAYMIGLSIESPIVGHNVCGVNTNSKILVLDDVGQVEGYFDTLAEVARHYIAKGLMVNGGVLRTIRASVIDKIITGYTLRMSLACRGLSIRTDGNDCQSHPPCFTPINSALVSSLVPSRKITNDRRLK